MFSKTSIVWALVLAVIGLGTWIAAAPAAWGQYPWELLYTFNGEAAGDNFGWSVCGAGDVNNDGYDDLIVGAMQTDAGGINHGRAYVYSGQTGALLWTFTGEAEYDELGSSVSGAGDVNNDGYDDLIVGAPQNDAGGSDAPGGRMSIPVRPVLCYGLSPARQQATTSAVRSPEPGM